MSFCVFIGFFFLVKNYTYTNTVIDNRVGLAVDACLALSA